MRHILLPGALLLQLHSGFAQQPGDLDLTFSSDGIAITDFGPNGNDYGTAMALQSDGRIVVVGSSLLGSQSSFALSRYMPDGSLDASFGNGGRVLTPEGAIDDVLQAVALQPDGRIVVAGKSLVNGTGYEWVVARYLSNGTLDATFAGDGILRTDVGDGSADAAFSVAIQPDGAIVSAGVASNTNDDDIGIVRCTADGVLDATFSGDGKLVLGYAVNDDAASAVALQPDGKIVVAGYTGDNSSTDFVVARFTPAGLPDSGFGSNGTTITSFGSSLDYAYALALRPDGKIVVGGSYFDSPFAFMALERLTADGQLDPTFDGDGQYTLPYPGFSSARAIAQMPDGRIVIGGASGTSYLVAVVEADGGMDNNFSSDGVVTTVQGDYAYGNGVALQPDGKIVLAGNSNQGATLNDQVVLRYHTDLSIGIEALEGEQARAVVCPNPVSDHAAINFTLAHSERVSVVLLDDAGHVVRDLARERVLPAGPQRMELDLSHDLAPGAYVIRISSAGGTLTEVRVVKV